MLLLGDGILLLFFRSFWVLIGLWWLFCKFNWILLLVRFIIAGIWIFFNWIIFGLFYFNAGLFFQGLLLFVFLLNFFLNFTLNLPFSFAYRCLQSRTLTVIFILCVYEALALARLPFCFLINEFYDRWNVFGQNRYLLWRAKSFPFPFGWGKWNFSCLESWKNQLARTRLWGLT